MTVVRDEASLPRLCDTPSGSVVDPSDVAGTPFGIARGVAAPSMASSEVLTGRKEAMAT